MQIEVASNAATGLRDLTVTDVTGRSRTARGVLSIGGSDAGRLYGRVRLTGAFSSAGARVTVANDDLSYFREFRSDARGRWNAPAIPDDTYTVATAKRGFEYAEQSVTVVGDASRVRAFRLGPETDPGEWNSIGNTGGEFFDATAIGILLPDGRIFYCHDTVDPVLFDPVSGQAEFPMASPSEQGCTSATLLADNRIVFIGGQSPANPGSFRNAVPWVKTYDPALGTWSLLSDLRLAAGRWYPGLARLSDGSLLAMGGGTAPNAARTATSERFDPLTETWTFSGSMLAAAEYPPAALLQNGKVLVTWAFPQLYDPGAGTWTATGTFVQQSRGWPDHSDHSLVVLADGRALVVGIKDAAFVSPVMAEIYDPTNGTWSLAANSALPRKRAEVVQLPDGEVLVAAGEVERLPAAVPDELGMVKWTDLYDPETNTWRRVADLPRFREYHAVSLLVPDGRVLVNGGTRIKFQTGPTTTEIDAYSPPYLSRGVRPSIVSASASVATPGDTLQLTVSPVMEITSVVLMGAGAHTHWVDGGVPRRLVVPVAQQGATLNVTLPADPNVLPSGQYLMFAMVDNIPSKALPLHVAAPQ